MHPVLLKQTGHAHLAIHLPQALDQRYEAMGKFMSQLLAIEMMEMSSIVMDAAHHELLRQDTHVHLVTLRQLAHVVKLVGMEL